ncbi:hypothetical protein ANCCEY_15391, partial [Ancylostoma ceylanicum]
MVLIDGMPIVSGLSTVYGLSGIPQALIERVEVVKGPASTLYGSEAVGGLINIITKKPVNAPVLSADIFGTTWGEINADIADQKIGFGQLTWHKTAGRNDLLVGATYRYTYYDDNTPATSTYDTIGGIVNMPSHVHLPGVFVQDEIALHRNHKLLLGVRYDYNSIHGSILTPRLNYKWNSENRKNVLRVSVGNGYRVANVFTEDHAALTGARQVVFLSELKPETSWNGNINYVKNMYSKNGNFVGLDATAFYTYFTNKVIPDYESDVNKIIYDNLDGYAISRGFSLNIDVTLKNGLKARVGGTFMDVYSVESGERERQLFSEKFTG